MGVKVRPRGVVWGKRFGEGGAPGWEPLVYTRASFSSNPWS